MAKKKDKKLKKGKEGENKKEKALKKMSTLDTSSPKKEKTKKTKKKPVDTQEKKDNSFSIGEFVKSARIDQKMTQKELATRCGTNKSYISRVENGSTDIRFSTLMRIVDAFEGTLKIEL